MFFDDELLLDCNTCVAANTTACSDCIVSHLLANDDGPIDLEPVPLAAHAGAAGSVFDEAIARFVRVGLVDDPPEFVSPAEFEAGLAATVGSR